MNFQVVWAAAGSPNAVFAVAPKALAEATGAEVVRVC
jgi:prolyl-tRNA editing enzyme YbaK/EbsC (Cys-tRNA(Pro) deacylase)